MKTQEHSPSVNDMYRGALFAAGDERYLGKPVDDLRFEDERNNPGLFVTGVSAQCSLAANALRHEKVRAHLQSSVSKEMDAVLVIFAGLRMWTEVRSWLEPRYTTPAGIWS